MIFYVKSLQPKAALLAKCNHFIRLTSCHNLHPFKAVQYLKTNGPMLASNSHSTSTQGLVQNDEIERKTFADVGPIEVDSSFVQLFKSYPYSDRTTSTNLSDISHRFSDDFLFANGARSQSQRPITMTNVCFPEKPDSYFCSFDFMGKRQYSTINNQPKQGNEPKTSDSSAEDEEIPKSKTAQLKKLFAVYGSFAVAFHIAISLVSVGICYLLVSSGIDIVGMFAKMGIETSAIAGGASTMVVAYAIHKLILPLRASITLVSVPILIRYLRRVGYFKK